MGKLLCVPCEVDRSACKLVQEFQVWGYGFRTRRGQLTEFGFSADFERVGSSYGKREGVPLLSHEANFSLFLFNGALTLNKSP